MKLVKALLCLILFYNLTPSFGQEKQHNLKYVLLIDNKVPVSTVGNFIITVFDSLNNKKKINLTYEVGELIFQEKDFIYLKSLKGETKIDLEFSYRSPLNNDFIYKINMEAVCFLEQYLIMEIKNNSGNIKKKKRYFLTYSIPLYDVVGYHDYK